MREGGTDAGYGSLSTVGSSLHKRLVRNPHLNASAFLVRVRSALSPSGVKDSNTGFVQLDKPLYPPNLPLKGGLRGDVVKIS